jgi:hypothetical protein
LLNVKDAGLVIGRESGEHDVPSITPCGAEESRPVLQEAGPHIREVEFVNAEGPEALEE